MKKTKKKTGNKSNKLVVVLGMHRSGTSAITHGLEALGVNLGDQLMVPKEGNNAKGFFEDVDIYKLNIEMLEVIESGWHHLAPIEACHVKVLREKGYVSQALDLLRKKTESCSGAFGFKDPRVAKLLLFWKEVFALGGFGVHYVLGVRNPLSIVKSLEARDGIDPVQSYFMWLDHVIASLLYTSESKRVLIDYDCLMQGAANELGRVAEKFNLSIDPLKLQSFESDFLENNLRHSIYEVADLDKDENCLPLVKLVYKNILEVASGAVSLDDAAFQKRVSRWENVLKRLKSSMLLVDRLGQAIAGRDGELVRIGQTIIQRDEQIVGFSQTVTERDGQVAELNCKVGELDGNIAVLNQWVAERDGQIIGLHQTVSERDGQITGLHQTVSERDGQIIGLSQTVVDRDRQIVGFSQKVAERDGHIIGLSQMVAELNRSISEYRQSTSWRLMAPLRWIGYRVKRVRHLLVTVPGLVHKQGGVWAVLPKALRLLRRGGLKGLSARVDDLEQELIIDDVADDVFDFNDYSEWVRRYDVMTDEKRSIIRERISKMVSCPLISIVMPTYNPNPEWLAEAIESVQAQLYSNWELCIADDASTDPEIRAVLEKFMEDDDRVKVAFREKNGHISAASNSALELVSGKWVALLDHDDILPEHAMFWVADAINKNPNVQMIYSDEDKFEDGERIGAYFKSSWNPDLFYSQNMFSHLGVYKKTLLDEVGGFRVGLEGSQDYDLALRCIELIEAAQIHHIPHVLYHWRIHSESTAHNSDAKPYAMIAGERALNEHFERKGIKGSVESVGYGYRAHYELPKKPPLVSLIIPTRNGLTLTRRCIDSILNTTIYPNYEIVVVDNGSDDPAAIDYFLSLFENTKVRVLRDGRPFNYSQLNNAAIKAADGEFVLLLNNDIEIISPDWLNEMVGIAIQDGVGCVGARLWYPDDTLQHGGVVGGIGGLAGHVHKHLRRGDFGYLGRASLIQSFSALTAACLLVRKNIYREVGGLNEKELTVAFNDVDFCLKVRDAGYRNVWTPYAELYHHESATRGYDDTPEKKERFKSEVSYMHKHWDDILMDDPAYNPNLTIDREDFSLAWPPRARECGI